MMPTRMPQKQARLDDLDRAIINRLQDGFPLVPNPFDVVADELGCSAPALINRLQRLIATGAATRFGPFFDAEAMGGACTPGAVRCRGSAGERKARGCS